jgi:cell wall-associated NlpC family hydrolase
VASLDDIPRSSALMCEWTQQSGTFHRTENAKSLNDDVFQALQPGDLLFWASSTSESRLQPEAREKKSASPPEGGTPNKTPTITHVMLYLGKRVKDGRHVIYGSSDGRSYEGQKRCGVSVFDFTLPKADAKVVFYGFGAVPEVRKAQKEL